MELKPCSKCGKRVSNLDIRDGDGANFNNRFYCRECAGIMNIEIKSDYSAVSSLQGKKSLSDTQFFKRAGKLFDNVDQRKREKMRRGRVRKKEPFHSQERKTRTVHKPKNPKKLKNPKDVKYTAIIIGGFAFIVILIILIIVIIAK